MPITEYAKERRKDYIGASDMPAILGLDRYKSPWDVWAEKTGKVTNNYQPGEAAEAGNIFEAGVLDWASTQLGKLIRNQFRVCHNLPILASNCDALMVDSGNPVDAKTAGLFRPLTEEWGEAGTDQVPERIIVQMTVQMLCTKTELSHIAAFLGGRGFNLYAIELDKELADMIMEEAGTFWNEHVIKDIPPIDCSPSMDTIRRIRREPESIVDIDEAYVAGWLEARQAAKEATEAEEAAKTALLAQLGTAEAGRSAAGTVLYKEQKRASYTVAESTYRVLRVQKQTKILVEAKK